MSKYGRNVLRGRPLASECYRAYSSGVEFYDDEGNGYCGCYGLMSDPETYKRECLECEALAWAITEEGARKAIALAANKHGNKGKIAKAVEV